MSTAEYQQHINRRRQPCGGCGKRTSATLCNACRPSKAQRPERACKRCPRMTTARSGVCKACQPVHAPSPGKVGPQHALKPPEGHGGGWVNVQGVRRWVTWPVPEVA